MLTAPTLENPHALRARRPRRRACAIIQIDEHGPGRLKDVDGIAR